MLGYDDGDYAVDYDHSYDWQLIVDSVQSHGPNPHN
jgi:hypothetical protein